MQDNELDDLFRSKLGGLEMEPAAQVWENIQAQLGGQPKKSWAPVWSIAATVLVLLTAGTWFLLDKPAKNKPNQVVQLKPAPKAIEPVKAMDPMDVEQVDIAVKTLPSVKNNITTTNHIASVKQSKGNKVMASVKLQKVKPATIPEPIVQPQIPVLASVHIKPVMQPIVPDMNLNAPQISTEPAIVKPVNALAAASITNETEKKVKKRGIHSLGGLINAVIAKVDKREDKLIEFTETDEDQSSVTGINLGLVKIKKDK